MSFQNGRAVVGRDVVLIPQSKSITTSGDQYIAAIALPFLLAAALVFYARTGVALFVAEGYRPYQRQVDLFTARYKRRTGYVGGAVFWDGSWWTKKAGQSTAAVPGTSIHGLGFAVDIWSGIDSSFQSAHHLLWVSVASALGWLNTGMNFDEPWHQEWAQARVRQSVSQAGTGTSTPINDEEDDMTPEQSKMLNDLNERTKVMRDTLNHFVQGTDVADFVTAVLDSPVSAASGTVRQSLRDTRTGVYTNQAYIKAIAAAMQAPAGVSSKDLQKLIQAAVDKGTQDQVAELTAAFAALPTAAQIAAAVAKAIPQTDPAKVAAAVAPLLTVTTK